MKSKGQKLDLLAPENIDFFALTRAEMIEFISHGEEYLSRREKQKSEESLYEFVAALWCAVEPETPFIGGWVLKAQCDHLQAITEGRITKLLCNVPPGSTKSLLTDCFWPAWEWGPRRMPHMRYLCCAYAAHLTVRDNRRFKQVIEHEKYRRYWGDVFEPNPAMYSTIQVGNNKTGWKLASSVGGVGTGERADRVIIDDPNNPLDVESEAVMTSTTTWFREVMPDRLNNLDRSAVVVIQQRTHEADVSGTILDLGLPYCHLSIPMEFDASRPVVPTDIGWIDPRAIGDGGRVLAGEALKRRDGVLAWPERFSADALDVLRRAKGIWAWSAQYQMLPAPRGGGIIEEASWQLWDPLEWGLGPDAYPAMGTIIASLDTAYSERQEADYNALTIWGAFEHPQSRKPKVMLRAAWQERMPLSQLVRKVIADCRAHQVEALLIENRTRGHDVRNEIYRLLDSERALRCVMVEPAGDKVSRLQAVQPLFENGIVYAPDRDWADAVIKQVSSFPRGRHDDLVDSASQALTYLRQTGVAVRREEYDAGVLESMRYRPPLQAPYPV